MSEEAKRPEDVNANAVESEVLTVFANEMKTLCVDLDEITTRREASEETRLCVWDNQSKDGRKHKADMGGKEPFPFEGAMDSRQRLADMTINERAMTLLVAAVRSVARLRGMEANDLTLAARLNTLLKWLITNQWGTEYIVEIMKGAQYTMGDSPALCVWGVFWQQETALAMQTIKAADLIGALSQAMPNQDMTTVAATLTQAIMDPLLENDAVGLLKSLIPEANKTTLRKAVKDLRETSEAAIPLPYTKTNRPRLKALRYGMDVFAPADTTDPKRARMWLMREWVQETELRDRVTTMNYREDVVQTIVGDKTGSKTGYRGKSSLTPADSTGRVSGDYSLAAGGKAVGEHKDEFEILTAFWRALDDDGVAGLWTVPFHGSVTDRTLAPIELFDYKHGEYPFTVAPREILNDRIFESRGVAELSLSAQASLKLFHDNKCDHVQAYTWPPVMRPKRAQRYALQFGPQSEWLVDRPGDTSFAAMPAPPAGLDEQQQEIQRQHDMYFGRPNPEVPNSLTELHMTAMTMLFLSFLRDALQQVVQLCQQYMTDEEIARVTGARAGVAVARSMKDIQGKYDLVLTFDPRELDTEFVGQLLEMAGKLATLDTESTIMRNELVRWAMEALNPALAERVLRPVEEATKAEIEDEQKNFALIAAGVEPTMAESGQNFGLRLNWIGQQAKVNPESMEKLTEDSRKILQNRIKHLQFQVEQQKNALIGKVGVSPVGE
jgi:hypothetical protein